MALFAYMKEKATFPYLDKLYERAYEMGLEANDKYVIFSDLHMGDGGATDDFSSNADMFLQVLKQYYLPQGYQLILNGDVEELQRFHPQKIRYKWRRVYDVFDEFHEKRQFYKTVGNHDMNLLLQAAEDRPYTLYEAIRLRHGEDSLFIFHGHQASKHYIKNNELIGFTLKYVANPLRIKNYSVSHSSKKQYLIEKRIYNYSRRRGLASIIGHTHRPLFETPLTRTERIKYEIEQLCRAYMIGKPEHKVEIEAEIDAHKKELKKIRKRRTEELSSSVYNQEDVFHVPCLFNSGCVIGKRGITAIEISEGRIRLVHWYGDSLDPQYLHVHAGKPESLGESGYYRSCLNEEPLDYIFTRIRLLR